MIKQLTLATLLVIGTLYQWSSFGGDDDDIPPGVYDSFSHYEVDFGKTYASKAERSYRLHVFYANYLRIADFYEDPDVTYFLEYTIFSDRTQEEFAQSLIRINPIDYLDAEEITFNISDVPASVDWREKKILSPVRDQGSCGSSYAFATVASIEAYMAQLSLGPFDLSEQQVLDCAYDGTITQGCKGGWPKAAFQWVLKSGLTSEFEYPYIGEKQSSCKRTSGTIKPKGYKIVSKSVDQLKAAVAIRPVTVCFDASQLDLYGSEIVNKNCDGAPSQCGLLVGYDEESWIVQNSWGKLWGEQGFVKFEMGETCGITKYAMFPI